MFLKNIVDEYWIIQFDQYNQLEGVKLKFDVLFLNSDNTPWPM